MTAASPRPVTLIVLLLCGILIVWAGTAAGLWLTPLLVSLVWALGAPSAGWRFGGALGISLAGYALPLAVRALTEPVGRSADVVASIMGFGSMGIIVWVLTLLFAALMAVAGAWLGHAVRKLAT